MFLNNSQKMAGIPWMDVRLHTQRIA